MRQYRSAPTRFQRQSDRRAVRDLMEHVERLTAYARVSPVYNTVIQETITKAMGGGIRLLQAPPGVLQSSLEVPPDSNFIALLGGWLKASPTLVLDGEFQAGSSKDGILLASDGLRLYEVMRGGPSWNTYVNIRKYGAVPDGTDVTTQIQAAFDDVPLGHTLYIPGGTYTVSGALVCNRGINILAYGAVFDWGTSGIFTGPTVAGLTFGNTKQDMYFLTVAGLKVTRTPASSVYTNCKGAGFHWYGLYGCHLNDVTASGFERGHWYSGALDPLVGYAGGTLVQGGTGVNGAAALNGGAVALMTYDAGTKTYTLTATANYTTVSIANGYGLNFAGFTLNYTTSFEDGNKQGYAYNIHTNHEAFLCRYGYYLEPGDWTGLAEPRWASGWCNQNTWVGGRLDIAGVTGFDPDGDHTAGVKSYTPGTSASLRALHDCNNNTFLNTVIEGRWGRKVYERGTRADAFINVRFEPPWELPNFPNAGVYRWNTVAGDWTKDGVAVPKTGGKPNADIQIDDMFGIEGDSFRFEGGVDLGNSIIITPSGTNGRFNTFTFTNKLEMDLISTVQCKTLLVGRSHGGIEYPSLSKFLGNGATAPLRIYNTSGTIAGAGAPLITRRNAGDTQNRLVERYGDTAPDEASLYVFDFRETDGSAAARFGCRDSQAAGIWNRFWMGKGLEVNTDQADSDTVIYGNVATPVVAVDASTQRVGVNTGTPAYALDVAGDVRATVNLRADTKLHVGAPTVDATVKRAHLEYLHGSSQANLEVVKMLLDEDYPGNAAATMKLMELGVDATGAVPSNNPSGVTLYGLELTMNEDTSGANYNARYGYRVVMNHLGTTPGTSITRAGFSGKDCTFECFSGTTRVFEVDPIEGWALFTDRVRLDDKATPTFDGTAITNYDPGAVVRVEVTVTATTQLQGLSGGFSGQVYIFTNLAAVGSGFNIDVMHNHASGTQKILTATAGTVSVGPQKSIMLIFNGTNWRHMQLV